MNLTSEFRNSRFYNVPKTVVDLGPFIGGLNSELRPDLISEHECQKLVNYSIRADGSLISRPSATYQIAPMAAVAGTSYYPVGQLTLSTGTKLYPLIAKVAGANTTFYYFDPTLGWLQAWASLAVTATRYKYLYYNGEHFLFIGGTLYSATAVSSGTALTAIASYATAVGTDKVVDAFIIHDRAVVVGNNKIYWSKATDVHTWAVPDGGSVSAVSSGGGAVNRATVFQDSVYVFKVDAVWRFSFLADPSIDGNIEVVVPDVGMYGGLVHNNELYMVNALGVYKWANGYLVELSEKIRSNYRVSASDVPNWVSSVLYNTPNIMKMDNLLVVGPFNTGAPTRYDTATFPVVKGSGAYYYVFNTELNVWTTWSFSANKNTNGVSGPINSILTVQLTTSTSFAVWAGLISNGSGGLLPAVYTMNSLASVAPIPSQVITGSGTDNFTRADGSTTGWTVPGPSAFGPNFQVASNEWVPESWLMSDFVNIYHFTAQHVFTWSGQLHEYAFAYRKSLTPSIDLSTFYHMTTGTLANDHTLILVWGYDPVAKTGYALDLAGDKTLRVIKITGTSTFTTLATVSLTGPGISTGYTEAGNTWKVSFNSTNGLMIIYIDGNELTRLVDTTYTTGTYFGMAWSAYANGTDWSRTAYPKWDTVAWTTYNYNSQVAPANDSGNGNVAEYIGHILRSKTVTLNDDNRWKRVFKVIIDALYNPPLNPIASNSSVGINVDGIDQVVIPSANKLLPLGKSYRCKGFYFLYDSLTNSPVDPTQVTDVELDNFLKVQCHVGISRETSI